MLLAHITLFFPYWRPRFRSEQSECGGYQTLRGRRKSAPFPFSSAPLALFMPDTRSHRRNPGAFAGFSWSPRSTPGFVGFLPEPGGGRDAVSPPGDGDGGVGCSSHPQQPLRTFPQPNQRSSSQRAYDFLLLFHCTPEGFKRAS